MLNRSMFVCLLAAGAVGLTGLSCDKGTGSAPDPLELIYPAGGESLSVGTTVTIRWKVNSPVSLVGVKLQKNELDAGTVICDNAINPDSADTLDWTPTSEQTCTGCRIKIWNYVDDSEYDRSGEFSIN